MKTTSFLLTIAGVAVLLFAGASDGQTQTTITITGDRDAVPSSPTDVRFEPIDGGGFASVGAEMDVTMPADVGALAIVLVHGDGEVRVSVEQLAAVQRDAEGHVVSRTMPRPSRASLVDARTLRYHNLYPGTDDEYTLFATYLKHDWVLVSQPALPAQTTWFGYDVRLTYSSGLTVEPQSGGLVVLNAHGEAHFNLPPIVAVDAAGREVSGRYRMLEQRDGVTRLAIEVAADWLMSASYPVRIDPTVVTVDSTSTSGNAWPFSFSGPFTYQQSYSATQMQQTSGMIERIGFEYTGSINGLWPDARIYIGETARNSTNFSYTFSDNFDAVSPTLAYDGSLSITGSGWTMITLDTPVFYSGQNTLLIQIELEPPTNQGTSVYSVFGGGPVECFRVYDRNSSTATTATQDSGYYFLHARFEISVQPRIDTTSLPDGTEGFAYSATLQASSGSTPYTWSATGLPAGLSLDANTGEISGTPDAADVGQHSVDVTVTDANSTTDSETFNFEIHPAVSVEPVAFPEGTATGDYPSVYPSTSGGQGPFTWSATGLPAGLDINPNSGVISGALAAGTEGSHTVAVTATDTNSDFDTYTTTLDVNAPPQITTDTLPWVTPNEPWGPYLIEHQGGTAPVTFSAIDLPEGLALDPDTGEISGEVEPGVITSATRFQATVTDVNGVSHTHQIGFVTQSIAVGGSGCDCKTSPHAAASNAPWLLLLGLLILLGWRIRLSGGPGGLCANEA